MPCAKRKDCNKLFTFYPLTHMGRCKKMTNFDEDNCRRTTCAFNCAAKVEIWVWEDMFYFCWSSCLSPMKQEDLGLILSSIMETLSHNFPSKLAGFLSKLACSSIIIVSICIVKTDRLIQTSQFSHKSLCKVL